ncbi:hypothetical protein CFP56_036147 [Quercus suber]|uniref:Uncharacterized protein n=1 Tax=Quercus suber TaxID=58331 RepID=A0AAW0LSK1_QUESU
MEQVANIPSLMATVQTLLSLFVDPDILRVFSVTCGNDIRERHVLDFELIRIQDSKPLAQPPAKWLVSPSLMTNVIHSTIAT